MDGMMDSQRDSIICLKVANKIQSALYIGVFLFAF